MDRVIDIRGLSKVFHGRRVVDRLNLSVPRGSIFALLGDNGAGKTTTIRVLTGLLRADEGHAAVLGQDCWQAAARLRHRVGYVPERPRFYDWMTVREIGWFTAGFHQAMFLPNYRELTERFGLDPNARLGKLSKGQYAKVALALALAPDPDVLVLDEPTSGLDLLVRREFLSSMVDLAGVGRTILISSHQISEVERVASHVAFLDRGRLLLASTMDELRERVVRLRLRFEGQAPDADRLGTVLQRNGAGRLWQAVLLDPDRAALEELRGTPGIHDVEQAALGLEDVYLALLTRDAPGAGKPPGRRGGARPFEEGRP
jgi:ABC-2 type transport system ATP-binding protein